MTENVQLCLKFALFGNVSSKDEQEEKNLCAIATLKPSPTLNLFPFVGQIFFHDRRAQPQEPFTFTGVCFV